MMLEEGKRRNLGRGLSALLGTEDAAEGASDSTRTMRLVPVDLIRPSKFQPRRHFDDAGMESLVASVRQKGILQPVLVRPDTDATGGYELIAGERRWRAAQIAQIHELPVIIRNLSDRDALEATLVENVQRQDLSPLEEAEGYRRLIAEFHHTQEDLAEVIGKSRSHIANMIRLLSLPESVKAMLESGKLTSGHARALLNSTSPEDLAQVVVRRGLSVRQTERLAQSRPADSQQGQPSRAAKDADTVALERDLSRALGLRVTIKGQGASGQMIIEYGSLEQLDEVVQRLSLRPTL